jgi:hypothetical protein
VLLTRVSHMCFNGTGRDGFWLARWLRSAETAQLDAVLGVVNTEGATGASLLGRICWRFGLGGGNKMILAC